MTARVPMHRECFFFFNDTATTEIYTLSLHDALPISRDRDRVEDVRAPLVELGADERGRSEEHTSELQSHHDIVCRLLLDKKKTRTGRAAGSPRTASRGRPPVSTHCA